MLKFLTEFLLLSAFALMVVIWADHASGNEIAPDKPPQSTDNTKCLSIAELSYFLAATGLKHDVYGPVVYVHAENGIVVWQFDYNKQLYCHGEGTPA